jgi:RNA polymerase primary sigma factor
MSRYLSDSRSLPRLTREDEGRLSRRASRGMREAQDELVLGNLGFVVKIAREYLNMGISFEDLVNEGNLGLLRAASRFDHRKGARFITYAVWWIRKSILKALASQGSLVYVSGYSRRKIARERSIWEDQGGTPPAASFPRPISLEEAVGGDRRRLVDLLADAGAEDPERSVAREEEIARVTRSLACLSAKERSVIAWRFGLAGLPVSTLKEIGERMGVTRERVRQIEAGAFRKLQKHLKR